MILQYCIISVFYGNRDFNLIYQKKAYHTLSAHEQTPIPLEHYPTKWQAVICIVENGLPCTHPELQFPCD